MSIYTRNGDEGYSSLYYSDRPHTKSSIIFDVLGNIDELNASLGFLHSSRVKTLRTTAIRIQGDLFSLGSVIADESNKFYKESFWADRVEVLEKTIDSMETDLPALDSFVLPGGTIEASYLHLSRTICRRMERSLVKYMFSIERDDIKAIVPYVNRLSDLLFVMARYANYLMGVGDEFWVSLE